MSGICSVCNEPVYKEGKCREHYKKYHAACHRRYRLKKRMQARQAVKMGIDLSFVCKKCGRVETDYRYALMKTCNRCIKKAQAGYRKKRNAEAKPLKEMADEELNAFAAEYNRKHPFSPGFYFRLLKAMQDYRDRLPDGFCRNGNMWESVIANTWGTL